MWLPGVAEWEKISSVNWTYVTQGTYDVRRRGRSPTSRGDPMSRADMTWRNRGACNGLDPAVFFPESEDHADEAKSICAECSVRVSCLEYALAVRERDGVWGGMTERERRRIIRQRRRSA
jgi:WhiB family redox-sensing transcriptional regulator